MARNLVGKRYDEMDEDYRSRVSHEEFKSRKDAQRMAGTKIEEGKAAGKTWEETARANREANYGVTNLEDFDLRSTGGGGTFSQGKNKGKDNYADEKLGRGRARLSRQDVKGLLNSGNFTAEEIMEYGNSLEGDAVFGGKAQAFLQRYMNEGTTGGETGGGETGGGETGGGETGGGETGGGETGGGETGGGEVGGEETVVGESGPTAPGLPVTPGNGQSASIGGSSATGTATGGDNEVKESFNATGGTMDVSGDITAGGDVTLDNSTTNNTDYDYTQTVTNNVRNYGGDSRIANISYGGMGSGSGHSFAGQGPKKAQYEATPVSDLTMASFYETSDSPGAAAKFVDMYTDLNAQNQAKYADTSKNAQSAIDTYRKNTTTNTAALDAHLRQGPLYNQAKSDLETAHTFGDIWKYNPKDFYMPNPFEPVEGPDFEGISDEIYDEIKSYT